KGAVNTILDINERFDITEQDKVFALSALNFDLSVYDIFGTLAIGASIVIPDSDSLREPAHWLDLINNEKVTVWNSVPALMRMLVEYSKGNEFERNFRSIKTVMLSGDWIPTSLPQEIKKYTSESTKVISLGGATEASIWSIYHHISEEDYTKPSIPYGKPLANQKFYVLNNNYESCPCYVTGDLYIGGIGLALGYWKDQEKTNNSFVINPITQERIYKTGDLGRYLPDGSIEFMGRADTQVKIQGFRIELGEIESALTSIDSVENAIVKVFGDKFKDKYLVAYIQPIKALYSTSNLIDEIKEKLSSKLPHYMIPSIFELVENFSLTTNGKVDRNSLKEPKKDISLISKSSNSKLVIQISNMVKEILNITEIDEESDLLSLGANSIDIVRLANLLESEFGFCPKVGDIFRLRTIKLLSEFYEANSSKIKNKVIDIPDTLILDPKEREAFKNNHFNISNISGETINLQNIENIEEYSNYKTTRTFSDKIISLSDFSKYLSSLALVKVNDIYKSMYGSAGSLYPVQIYIQVRENRIENIKQGLYYYNQYENKLVLISKEDNLNKNIHFSTNIDIYETSGFSIFLVGYIKSIEPIYSSSSLDYCLIEAGSITQLLRMKAPDYNLGICSIGQVDNEKVIKEAKLSDKHVILHTLLVGSLDENQTNETWSFVIEENSDDDWEEITI
ncbi:MAG: AMP-binding protein, partial [Candidatus Sericytochromatia bacterium]